MVDNFENKRFRYYSTTMNDFRIRNDSELNRI